MKKTTGYTIDHANGKIIVNKTFNKKASTMGSNEYVLLLQLIKETGYNVEQKEIEKNSIKNTHKGLTIEYMSNYIAKQENAKEELELFEKVKLHYKGYSSYYTKVKAWFLKEYPNYKTPEEFVEVEEVLELKEKVA